MDLMQKAQGAPYYLATSIEDCPLHRFWVVQLDEGFEIYQTPEDPTLAEPSSWMRLKQFCEENNVKPINMARAGKDLDPATQINFDPLADAYFYARRTRKMMAANPMFAGYTDNAEGFGELHRSTLKIVWEHTDGRIEPEERRIDERPTPPISLIYKD